jgi:hypothetical protein
VVLLKTQLVISHLFKSNNIVRILRQNLFKHDKCFFMPRIKLQLFGLIEQVADDVILGVLHGNTQYSMVIKFRFQR